MSFLKRLFGRSTEPAVEAVPATEYQGHVLRSTPQREGQQYRLCGTISQESDGATRTHHLIRADLFMSAEDATEAFLRKARQVVDERGDKLYD